MCCWNGKVVSPSYILCSHAVCDGRCGSMECNCQSCAILAYSPSRLPSRRDLLCWLYSNNKLWKCFQHLEHRLFYIILKLGCGFGVDMTPLMLVPDPFGWALQPRLSGVTPVFWYRLPGHAWPSQCPSPTNSLKIVTRQKSFALPSTAHFHFKPHLVCFPLSALLHKLHQSPTPWHPTRSSPWRAGV